VIGFVVGALVMLLGGLFVAEVRGWLPILSRLAIRLAACRLPAAHRGRYAEEWLAEFDAYDAEAARPISTIVFGLRICLRASRVGAELNSPREALSRGARVVKRAADLATAFTMLLVMAPTFVVVALAVRVESPGPVLYRQRRMGEDGRTFDLFKFRTMPSGIGPEDVLGTVADSVVPLPVDPRLTRVGRFLQRYSFDEFPLFFNVLRGDMSLVGPRPRLPTDPPGDKAPSSLRPGLVDPWLGRGPVTPERMEQLGKEYATKWSLWRDLKLILRTVPVALKADLRRVKKRRSRRRPRR
jgi:lipopolysaccharide/colanic/teichoic acid biosynthesis glycosyltransferase